MKKAKPIKPERRRRILKQPLTMDEAFMASDKVNKVAKMLAKGLSQKEIKMRLTEEWGCTEQNIHYYIKRAIKAMQSSIERKLDYVIALQRERLEFILNGAIEKKDYSSAQKIIDSMNKLYGLYEEKKNVKIDAPTIKFDFGNINNADKDVEDSE